MVKCILPKLRNGSKTVQARVFTTVSLTFYLERYHAPFDGREGEGSEKNLVLDHILKVVDAC